MATDTTTDPNPCHQREPALCYGRAILPGIMVLTGLDLKPLQTTFRIPELADPYVTRLPGGAAVISGTAQYHLKFRSIDDIRRGGPYQVVWNEFHYADGTPMEGGRTSAHTWDMKPVPWVAPASSSLGTDISGISQHPRLWNPNKDTEPPLIVWYGGHMRPRVDARVSHWPEDNFSRDVFAFTEKTLGQWFSFENSIFSKRGDWPRRPGNFLGHRYGHQIVMVSKPFSQGQVTQQQQVPAVFFEEVTNVRADGGPQVTKIFMDEMISPYQASGNPVELISPINPSTGRPYPSAVREDGSLLVEGPLYFRFHFEGEPWEAIGFSSGSFYGKYPAVFASRKVTDGLAGKPYQLDLNDEGTDFHDAGAELGRALNMIGGPGRPSVLVDADGMAVPGPLETLQVLVHGYRRDILPEVDGIQPLKYRFDQMFRVVVHAFLKVVKGPRGALRFQIAASPAEGPAMEEMTGLLNSSK